MCGRYTLIKLIDFVQLHPWIAPPDGPPPARYNIAPSQPVSAALNDEHPKLDSLLWGLVPSWAKDTSIGARMINARAETLAEKPSFRTSLRRRRCLIPADGFYEWRREPDGKTRTPMYIRMRGGRPFAFAGLWDQWQSPDGSSIRSCTIITTTPNRLLESIHDRMPVILADDESCRRWLTPGEADARDMQELLVPCRADQMEAYSVSRAVNSPRNDTPQCIEPAGQPRPTQPGLF